MSNMRKIARSKAKERWAVKNADAPAVGDGRGFNLANILLSDIGGVHMDVTENVLEVTISLPVGNNEAYAEYQELLDLDELDESAGYLQRAAKEFVNAVARAVRERQFLKRDLPCATCTSACCRNSDIQVTASDVARMDEAGIDVTDAIDYYDAEQCSGHVGEFAMVPAEVHFGDDSPEDAVCPHLRPDGCSIYAHRPTICREYSAWTCEAYEPDSAKKDGLVQLRVVP